MCCAARSTTACEIPVPVPPPLPSRRSVTTQSHERKRWVQPRSCLPRRWRSPRRDCEAVGDSAASSARSPSSGSARGSPRRGEDDTPQARSQNRLGCRARAPTCRPASQGYPGWTLPTNSQLTQPRNGARRLRCMDQVQSATPRADAKPNRFLLPPLPRPPCRPHTTLLPPRFHSAPLSLSPLLSCLCLCSLLPNPPINCDIGLDRREAEEEEKKRTLLPRLVSCRLPPDALRAFVLVRASSRSTAAPPLPPLGTSRCGGDPSGVWTWIGLLKDTGLEVK
ncbi:hypothetical protein BS78_06G279600 [Paspalum vaginatum]|nr:hypothetical protein BS78_06G279600 [Paspalum vaginatum]